MTQLHTSKTSQILAKALAPYERLYGATIPTLAAMLTRRYMHEYGMPYEALARVAIKNHYNGSLNTFAQFQNEITMDTIMNSKYIASPLRLYDCSPISDGAAALILTTKPPKRKINIKVTGIGHATERFLVQHRDSLTRLNSTVQAAKMAYNMSGRSPMDIDLAEIHDAFTSFEIIGSEDLGFFRCGNGWRAVMDGKTEIGGELPINPSGGLKSRGHPVGVSGLAQIVELVWQLRHELDNKRQIKNAKIGLTHSIGGLANNNSVNIIERTI